jgi:hypothetical protein
MIEFEVYVVAKGFRSVWLPGVILKCNRQIEALVSRQVRRRIVASKLVP